jgi:hypothetical protein
LVGFSGGHGKRVWEMDPCYGCRVKRTATVFFFIFNWTSSAFCWTTEVHPPTSYSAQAHQLLSVPNLITGSALYLQLCFMQMSPVAGPSGQTE